MKVRVYKIAFAAAALGAPLAIAPFSAAQAQEAGDRSTILIDPDFDRSDVAGMRSEPAYSARPLRVGAFQVEASLATIAAFESNVLRQTNEQSDASLTLTPRLRARTDASGFQLDLRAIGVFRRFASLQTENSEEFEFSGGVRTDLPQLGSIYANASFARDIEPRSSVGTVNNAAEPVSSDVLNGTIGAEFRLGKLRISPSLNFRNNNFADVDLVGGGSQDLGFRDIRKIGGALSVGYELSPLLTVFARGEYDDQESTNAAPGADRSAEDYALLAGIRGELSPLVVAELAAGYRNRNFDLARYRDSSGATFRANVQWFATPLMSFRVQASQVFLNGGQEQIGDVLSSRLSASIYYDPLRNVRLASTISYTNNDFRDVDTTARRAGIKVQGQYFLNPNFALGSYVSILRQNVNGTQVVLPSTNFTAGVGVILTP